MSRTAGDPRFSEISRERVSDRVAQEITKLISSGQLAPGERLPGERQLAEMMSVSRVSVRAALQQLKAQGLVSAVQGGGTRVAAAAEEVESGLTTLVRSNPENLNDLIEIRTSLEIWAARRAAKGTARAKRNIEAAMQRMRENPGAPAHKTEDDLRFHMAIAKASGSAIYLHLMDVMQDIVTDMIAYHRHAIHTSPQDDLKILGQHEAINKAIQAGRPELAASAMAEHLDYVSERYRAKAVRASRRR